MKPFKYSPASETVKPGYLARKFAAIRAEQKRVAAARPTENVMVLKKKEQR